MKTVCSKCGRKLNKAIFYYEGKPVGPTCYGKLSPESRVIPRAKKGRKRGKSKAHHVDVVIDKFTIDMFGDEDAIHR